MSDQAKALPERVHAVIITGGSRGLGAGFVESFLNSGDRVATCARSITPEVEKWQSNPATADRFYFQTVDVADREQNAAFVKAVVDKWDSVEVLVNNAGVARDGILGVFSDDDTEVVINLNLKGTIHMTKLVSRRMMAREYGRIINISSIVGLSGYRGLTVCGATKAALDGFTRALARELGSKGITVNSVAPGYLRGDEPRTRRGAAEPDRPPDSVRPPG